MKKLQFAVKKHISVAKLKKKAWELFSQWVRYSTSIGGLNTCITCGVWKPWKDLQAGHFIPGRHNSILFDERGCHPQCYHCNMGLKGNPRAYDWYMKTTYGQKVIDDLERLDRITKNYKPFELEALLDTYKQKLNNL